MRRRDDLLPPEPLLAGALGRGQRPAGAHLDLQEVASFLDRALPRSRRRAVEAHLASCAPCRELAVDAALSRQEAAEDTPSWRRLPSPRLHPSLIALAAAALLGLGIVLLLPRPQPALRALGVLEPDLEAVSPPLAELAVAGARGQWPPLTGFEAFIGDDRRPALRGPSHPQAPVPLAPRWSVVREIRPAFAWYPPSFPASDYELLVVDEAEASVGHQRVALADLGDESGVLTLPYPEAFPSLEPGRAYAWKVNAVLEGEWTASAFVPFRVATAEEEREVTARRGSTPNPFLQAAALVAGGFHDEALERLSEVPAGEARARVVRSVLERQGLPPPVVERELARLGEAGE